MVDHKILLHKFNHYGIRGIANKWFKSYLTNRKQYVSMNGADSSCRDMEYGVPQGSILGPLLFVLYINDLPGISTLAKFILYADDANIIISGNNIYEIEDQLNLLSQSLVKWVNLIMMSMDYLLISKNKLYDIFPTEDT